MMKLRTVADRVAALSTACANGARAMQESAVRHDVSGNPALDKSRSRSRIDALQAGIMAVGMAKTWQPSTWTIHYRCSAAHSGGTQGVGRLHFNARERHAMSSLAFKFDEERNRLIEGQMNREGGRVTIDLEPQGADPFHGRPESYDDEKAKVVPIHTIYEFNPHRVDDDDPYWVCRMVANGAHRFRKRHSESVTDAPERRP